MDRVKMVELFISEFEKLINLLPYQKDMLRKVLLNHNKDQKLYILIGRQQGHTYLKNLYNQIFAE